MAQLDGKSGEKVRQNGEEDSEELKKLLGEVSQLKESLRLEKSRNADTDCKHKLLHIR